MSQMAIFLRRCHFYDGVKIDEAVLARA